MCIYCVCVCVVCGVLRVCSVLKARLGLVCLVSVCYVCVCGVVCVCVCGVLRVYSAHTNKQRQMHA